MSVEQRWFAPRVPSTGARIDSIVTDLCVAGPIVQSPDASIGTVTLDFTELLAKVGDPADVYLYSDARQITAYSVDGSEIRAAQPFPLMFTLDNAGLITALNAFGAPNSSGNPQEVRPGIPGFSILDRAVTFSFLVTGPAPVIYRSGVLEVCFDNALVLPVV